MSAKPIVVDFFADISCPWCYVGWAALKQAASERSADYSLSVAWRTFMLSPEMPADGVDRKAYLEHRFAPEQLRAAHQALEAAAEAANAPLSLSAPARIPSTIDAHRVIHWAAEQAVAEPVIDAMFHAYWVDGRDVSEGSVLKSVGESAGMDPHEIAAKLATNIDRDVVLEFHAAAQKIGVTGVPVAIFNQRVPMLGAQSAEAYARGMEAAAA